MGGGRANAVYPNRRTAALRGDVGGVTGGLRRGYGVEWASGTALATSPWRVGAVDRYETELNDVGLKWLSVRIDELTDG